jgi:hypothetical protein
MSGRRPRTEKEKLIATAEDWYPTDDGKVRVKLILLSTGQWRVCCWGGDDFGLEKDFPKDDHGYGENHDAALKLYTQITDNTSQAQMRSWGMYNA